MKNGSCVIGLIQGMFEHNILTFNPIWNQDPQRLEALKDIRGTNWQLMATALNLAA
jgi:hypothetical protein